MNFPLQDEPYSNVEELIKLTHDPIQTWADVLY